MLDLIWIVKIWFHILISTAWSFLQLLLHHTTTASFTRSTPTVPQPQNYITLRRNVDNWNASGMLKSKTLLWNHPLHTLFSTASHPPSPQTNATTYCPFFIQNLKQHADNLPPLPPPTHPSSHPRNQNSNHHPFRVFHPSPLCLQLKSPNCSLPWCSPPATWTPFQMTKACLPSFIPLITNITSASLTTGSVPPSLKLAKITPSWKNLAWTPINNVHLDASGFVHHPRGPGCSPQEE